MRLAKAPLSMFFGGLLFAFSGVLAESRLAGETSVAEPTRLQTVVSADGSELAWSRSLGEIESADASAAISTIEIRGPGGERVRGVKISLEDSGASDEIYITETLLSDFRDELQKLQFTGRSDRECRARYRCIHGIARCRPSQTERQAYCPGRYSTPNSEKGIILSTPRRSFSFPSVDIARLDALISEAVQALE